jgi:hypothetical protein
MSTTVVNPASNYVVARISNTANAAEGTLLPPPQKGQTRVPYVQGFQIQQTVAASTNTAFTLTWQNVVDNAVLNVDHYNLYYTIQGTNAQPVGPFTATQSPATISVPSTGQAVVSFICQTVLANGLASDITASPATTGTMIAPSISGAFITPGTVTLAAFAAGIQPPQIVSSLPALPSGLYPQGALVVLTTNNTVYRSTGAAWTDATDGSTLLANSVTTGALAAGSVTTNVIAAAAVDATRIDIFDDIVVGMTLTNNNPSAGNISWSACTVYYNGTTYPISAGNTTATSQNSIYWTVGGTTLTPTAAFAPGPNIFLIATNTGGTADTAWNKQAANSIVAGNIAAGAVGSTAIQNGALNNVDLFAAGLQPPTVVSTLPTLPSGSYPQGSLVVLTTNNTVYRSTGSTWTNATDGSTLIANSVTTGSLAAGAVTTPVLAAAAVDATKINIVDELVVGLTLTNNTPTAADVAWSACTVYYSGLTFSIPAGNTTGGNQFIWWYAGGSGFNQTATFSPSAPAFMIATNTLGISDTAWNKTGTGAITGSHINLPAVIFGPNGSFMMDDLTWTNNYPTAGIVGWSACTVIYQGNTYSIPAGNTGATGVWIYWTLASPNVFQAASSYPVLGINDFMVGINGSFGSTGALGNYNQVFEMHSNNDERSYTIPDGHFFFNAEGFNTFSIARTAADSVGLPAAGQFRIFNGTGTGGLGSGQTIIGTGVDGHVQMSYFTTSTYNYINSVNNYPGTVLGPPSPYAWIHCYLDGNACSIPAWSGWL